MLCKTCVQLEEAVAAADRPDPPDILVGLTEAGIRNRALQRDERKTKALADLEKHRRLCRIRADAMADTPAF